MKKDSWQLVYRVSVILAAASAAVRFLLGWFRNFWIRRHLEDDSKGLIYLHRDRGGQPSVFLAQADDKNGRRVVLENCTGLFLQLTWVDIIRKVMAFVAVAGICLYGLGLHFHLHRQKPGAGQED